VLLNNAGIGDKGTSWDGIDAWRKVFEVNLFGWVSHGVIFQSRDLII